MNETEVFEEINKIIEETRKAFEVLEKISKREEYIPTSEEYEGIIKILVQDGESGLNSAISMSLAILYKLGYTEGVRLILKEKTK